MKKEMTITEFARLGGLASVKKRLAGKSKEEISAIMKLVRAKQNLKKTEMSEAGANERGKKHTRGVPIEQTVRRSH